jgi:hypothetical protein
MAMLSYVHQLFSAEHCQAYIHTLRWRSYWIPGSYTPALSEKHNSLDIIGFS